VTWSHATSGFFVGGGLCGDCATVVILLFDVLFLFVLENKECALTVRRTTAAQIHATWFRHCRFSLPKSRDVRHGDSARRLISAEPITDWSDPGQLTFVSCPVYVSSAPCRSNRSFVVVTTVLLRDVDHGGLVGPNPLWKYIVEARLYLNPTPKTSRSFIQNCCWIITPQISHHQRWMTYVKNGRWNEFVEAPETVWWLDLTDPSPSLPQCNFRYEN